MSEAHLGTGSQQPPKVDGLLRLYSMKFCPYAQRVRLVLNAKKIPHDVVNVNLINKPEWYFKVHPEGKVPAVDNGSKVVVESLDISDWLDEQYPENPLYPAEPAAKQKDKDLIQKMGPLITVFSKCAFGLEKKTPEEWIKEFTPVLDVFEKELAQKGTVFFGGEKPRMVDYMLWPWGERVDCLGIALGQKLPLGDDQFPLIRKWRKAMRADPVCDEIYEGPERFWKVVQFKLKNLPPDYDNV